MMSGQVLCIKVWIHLNSLNLSLKQMDALMAGKLFLQILWNTNKYNRSQKEKEKQVMKSK
jgi:hypothetical protein